MSVVEQLGELLRGAGFGRERHSLLTQLPWGVPPPEVLAAAGRGEDARLANLAALFQCDQPVASASAAEAIRPLRLDLLVHAGLIEAVGTGVRSRVKVDSYEGLLVAGDPLRHIEGTDYVIALSPASAAVAGLTVRRPIATALDVGTGSGIQALLAARHAGRVVGVDVNAHALHCAGLSQKLNGMDNIRWVEGDWFEPVRGHRFDLIVVNPSVIITPDNEVLWRDSAVGGEALSHRLVRESADHLNEGGFATVLCHWATHGDTWEREPREWVSGLGCDALLLHLGSHEPLAYMMSNVVDSPNADATVGAERFSRWARYYKETGVEQIAWGVVVLRRRSERSNWVRSYHLGRGRDRRGGDQLERVFNGCDTLSADSGAEQFRRLLAGTWRLVDGHRLEQTLGSLGGTYAPSRTAMTQRPGMNLDAAVDPRVLPLLDVCDGERSLGKALSQTPPPAGLDRSDFHNLCLGTVRDLIAKGFLLDS